MNPIKKILLPLTFLTLIALCFIPRIEAAPPQKPPVSPALAVITEEMQMHKSGLKNTPLYLNKKDFETFLSFDGLKSLTFSTLPSVTEGTLTVADYPVTPGQTVSFSEMNKLKFIPANKNVTTATFRFSGGDTSCGSSIKCTLHFFDEVNTAPVIISNTLSAEKLTTVENIMVYSTVNAVDSENDKLIFEVLSEPRHGIVSFADDGSGRFTYTPALDYSGKDSFEYVVWDEYGNRSDSAKIKISVEKNDDNTFFADMLRREEHKFAVKAASAKIMSGKLVDGQICFLPEASPTKAEFLDMALKAAGVKINVTDLSPGFADDSDIPSYLRSSVAYGASKGYISGTKTENGVFFYPNSPITRAEAAVLINNIINAESKNQSLTFADKSDIPSWAAEDVSVLAELKIMEGLSDGSYYPNDNVTNAQAAKIFCRLEEFNSK